MPIVWQLPNGTVRVTTVSDQAIANARQEGEDTATVLQRFIADLQARDPDLTGAIGRLVPTADMPATRAERHRWRLVGGRVVVDPTVPSPPHPRQALLDEIAAAVDVSQLKTALGKLVRG